MSVVNLKHIQPKIWIPPATTPRYKFTVTSNGVEEDITKLCSKITVEDYITESIGKFSFSMVNVNNLYSNKWVGNEIVKYYKNYTDNSTLYFRGRIEQPSKNGFNLDVSGRSESLHLMNVLVTLSTSVLNTSIIIQNLLTAYGSPLGFTGNNINTASVTLTVNWYRKPFWDCIQDVCTASGFDFWIDANKDWNFFPSGTRQNTSDAIVHGSNLAEVGEFTPDITQVRNRIKVSGAVRNNIQVFYTAEDAASQALYGVKEEALNDDNITSFQQAKDVGDYELALKKNPPLTGSIKSAYLLGTYNPGQALRVSAPIDNLPFGYYYGVGYKDELDFTSGNLTTTVFLNKEPRKISHVLKDSIEQQNTTNSTYTNPNDQKNSFDFAYFSSSFGSFSNGATVINNSLYSTISGGIWVSADAIHPARVLPTNITSCYLILNGSELQNVTVQVSGNGGTSYQNITNGQYLVLSSAVGTNLQIKITLNSVTANISSLSLQYNTA